MVIKIAPAIGSNVTGRAQRCYSTLTLILAIFVFHNNHLIFVLLQFHSVDSTLVSFSLTRNWYKLTGDSGSNSELARDLRPINAIRCLCMFGVILGHSALSLSIVSSDLSTIYMTTNFILFIDCCSQF